MKGSLKKPGRMRWEYVKPQKKLMVADGKTLWIYEPDDEQAYRHDLKGSSLPSSVSFLLGEGRLTDELPIANAMLMSPSARGAGWVGTVPETASQARPASASKSGANSPTQADNTWMLWLDKLALAGWWQRLLKG